MIFKSSAIVQDTAIVYKRAAYIFNGGAIKKITFHLERCCPASKKYFTKIKLFYDQNLPSYECYEIQGFSVTKNGEFFVINI